MNIYIGNLSLETTEDELRREFIRFGEVISVVIMNDDYIGSGQPRSYGYVQMSSKAAGKAAITALVGKIIREREVIVVESLPLTQAKPVPFKKTTNPNRSGKARLRRQYYQ